MSFKVGNVKEEVANTGMEPEPKSKLATFFTDLASKLGMGVAAPKPVSGSKRQLQQSWKQSVSSVGCCPTNAS